MEQELWAQSASDIAAAIRTKEITALEALEAALARMEQENPAINAVTVPLVEEARRAAAEADRAVAAGEALGPLHGVPITVKENVDQKGLANTNGVPAFAENIAPDHSPVVANLLNAGAVIFGRTNTPEFSIRWFTDNPLRGKTLNPWDHGITPGGSSGGASAALAAGIGALTHGNDLGGSLRYPAYCCGLTTIKPSLGRVPAYTPSSSDERPFMLQSMSVQGPIAREVRDLRLALSVMAARDPRDPHWVPAPLEGPALPAPVKVAVTKGGDLDCHPGVAEAVDQAAKILEAGGYQVELVDPPKIAQVAETWLALFSAEVSQTMMSALYELGSEAIQFCANSFLAARGEEGGLLDFMTLQGRRSALMREWALFMEDYPLILAPVSLAPPLTQDSDLESQERFAQLLREQTMLYVVNTLGLPSAAVATGLYQDNPMGVQIIGRRFREDICMDAAEVIEQSCGSLAPLLWQRGKTG